MKSLLVAIFLITNFTGLSQENKKIPKGINKIILKTGLSESENIQLISNALKKNNLLIEKFDTLTHQIQTSKKNPNKKSIRYMTYSLTFNIFSNKIIATCNYSTNTSTNIAMYNTPISISYGYGGIELITNKKQSSYINNIFKEFKSICIDIVEEDKIEYEFINQNQYRKFLKNNFK